MLILLLGIFGCLHSGEGGEAAIASGEFVLPRSVTVGRRTALAQSLKPLPLLWGIKGLWDKQRSSPEIQALLITSQPVQGWSEVTLS